MRDRLINAGSVTPETGLPAGAVTLGKAPARVTLSDLGPYRIVQLQAWAEASDTVAAWLGRALGTRPPGLANRWVGEPQHVRVVWHGPNRWWLVTPEPGLLDPVLATVPEGLATITEQGAGRSVLAVRGQAARDLLAKLCPLDLDRAAFPPDGAAGTVLHHINIHLVATATGLELFLPRSSAASTLAIMLEAGAEYGVAYQPHTPA